MGRPSPWALLVTTLVLGYLATTHTVSLVRLGIESEIPIGPNSGSCGTQGTAKIKNKQDTAKIKNEQDTAKIKNKW